MNVRHPMGVLDSFSIKNIFYYKIDLRLFHFNVTNCSAIYIQYMSHLLIYMIDYHVTLLDFINQGYCL